MLISSARVRPPPPLVRCAFALAAALLGVACDPDKDPVHPSYDRCEPGEPCGLSTTCERAQLTTRDAGAASLCTRACSLDSECPGFSARCVMGAADAGQCLRECARDLDCRPKTTCHGLRINDARVGVCVPDTGPRACATGVDCAPFDDVCDLRDAGVSPFDAAAANGTCRFAVP